MKSITEVAGHVARMGEGRNCCRDKHNVCLGPDHVSERKEQKDSPVHMLLPLSISSGLLFVRTSTRCHYILRIIAKQINLNLILYTLN